MGYQTVVAHDYLTQHGGAERVALEISLAFKANAVVTSCYSQRRTLPGFDAFRIITSFLQLVPGVRSDPRRALPVLPLAWRSLRVPPCDVLICSSSGWSHMARAKGAIKVVYCHNPARWLYQPEDYFLGKGRFFLAAWRVLSAPMRLLDGRAASSADAYIANSSSVAQRIKSVYGISATVVPPAVQLSEAVEKEEVGGLPADYWLSVGRSRGYKNTAMLVDAFKLMPEQQLLVVGEAPDANAAIAPNVRFLGRVSDGQLRTLYENARALISVSREDFGLTPLEANSFGTPALLLRGGGFLDTLIEGVTGMFIEDESLVEIVRSVRSFPLTWDSSRIRAHAGHFSAQAFKEGITAAIAEAAAARGLSAPDQGGAIQGALG